MKNNSETESKKQGLDVKRFSAVDGRTIPNEVVANAVIVNWSKNDKERIFRHP